MASQQTIDRSNADFWDTLCGWNMARDAGITGDEAGDLSRFDELYFSYYPYLKGYVPPNLSGTQVLEIGLGFGTLGQLLASRGGEYHGVDIAAGPVSVMKRRIGALGQPEEQVQQASALDLPYADASFDSVYSIGCLHHTGDLQRSISEVYRVLRPGGRAVVMLYNRHSLRRLAFGLVHRLRGGNSQTFDDEMRVVYDAHPEGSGAPHTDFVSRGEVKRLFSQFSHVRIDAQNFDGFRFGLERKWFLSNLARVAGLDLYVVADKSG